MSDAFPEDTTSVKCCKAQFNTYPLNEKATYGEDGLPCSLLSSARLVRQGTGIHLMPVDTLKSLLFLFVGWFVWVLISGFVF